MKELTNEIKLFEQKNIWKILLKIALPVMTAQLIQALYNIVDSLFVGRFSEDGLTALSVIFPIQLIITAIATGTGVGVNTKMSRHYATGETEQAKKTAGTGTVLALISWIVFAIISVLIMKPYVTSSAKSEDAIRYAISYGSIVCTGSLGLFLESIWSKVHQAGGNMRLTMFAQIIGALTNMILDPILIFGYGLIPAMGIAGAAYATVAGQTAAALITISGFYKPPNIREISSYAKKFTASDILLF
jgi:Na+-driven multidrug efflux pump